MIYHVIAYFRSPNFVESIHAYLSHLAWHGDQSLFDIIQSKMIEEIDAIPKVRFMKNFDEKQTFQALMSFIYAQKTMTCFRRVFMSNAHKYFNNPDGKPMNDEIAKVSLPRNDKD
jgi:hypothetical protein